MRPFLILTLLLALLAAVAAPAEARAKTCTSLTDAECGSLACADRNANGEFERSECAYPEDHIDTCAGRSDCCGTFGTGLWCPPDS